MVWQQWWGTRERTAPATRREAAHALRAPRLDLARGLGLVVTALTLFVGGWRLGRPALWLDEAASIVATQRTWPGLWTLTRGADAPLVPYYALLKVISGALAGSGAPPELVYRWPSVIAVAVAAGVLTTWLARRGGAPVAAATAVALLLTGGISRYAQEARPYALVLLGAVLATYAWSRLAETGRWQRVPLYALAVAFMVVMHSLSATSSSPTSPRPRWPCPATPAGGPPCRRPSAGRPGSRSSRRW